MSHKPSKRATASLRTLTRELRDTLALLQNAPLALGEKLTQVQVSSAFPDSFPVYCEAELGLPWREAYRYMAHYRVHRVALEIFGCAPNNKSVARWLGPIAADPQALRAVAQALKHRGLTLATATNTQIAQAIRAARKKTK